MQYALKILVTAMLMGCFLSPLAGHASDREDTLLMFVGEDLDVLSIASRREESARQAPAVATVLTRDMIARNGIFTLSDALGQTPGFYMAQKEWGSRPYLRGVPDSLLFLYDTVPMTSDMTKSVHPLDEDLSLAPVKRIEIIRGPGSVLWGPDAFAGIVNVVPMTGKDLHGVETGAHYSAPGDGRGAYVNAGHDGGAWDGFLSINARETEADDRAANIVSFWGDGTSDTPVPPEERYGVAHADRPYFVEVVGNTSLRDFATLSGRYSDYSWPYAMADEDQEQDWIEDRSTPVNYLKLESKKDVGLDAALRFTGYYSTVDAEHEVIDLALAPKERTAYSELIFDQNLWSGKGLLTAGAAYRNTDVSNAPVWDSYLPGYLVPENETFLPRITEVDYRSELWSVFGQYAHKIGKTDVSFGLRHDAHDFYDDSLSYNCGIVWSPTTEWGVKLLYGSAYRTPYTSQLLTKQDAGFEDIPTHLEEINTVNAEVSWRPGPRFGGSLGGFVNHISNHVMENAYAGLSDPNSQKIYGLELEGMVSPVDRLEFSANLTATRNTGPDEMYRYADGIIIDPDDGSIDINYTELRYPFDTGPDRLVNFMVRWKPFDRVSLFCRTGYTASVDVICPTCVTPSSLPGVWLTDVALTFQDIGVFGLDAGLYLNNMTDKNYQVPGTYSLIDGEPFSVRFFLKRRW
jgi:outer membrane receptor protein involved in Fe transport